MVFWGIICTVILLAGSGCTMAPKYARPDAPIPNTYPGLAETGEAGESAPPPMWTEFFQDAPMRRVIELALANNRDLRVSMLNIEKTRAQYRIQRADILPSIDASGSSSNQHLPASLSSTGEKGMTRQYSASLGFSSFELDLFGRIRSLTEQALETYYSVEEEARSARLSLVAETAAMYLQLVADREVYDLTLATAENRRKTHDLIVRKFDAGVASDLDVSQARTILEEAMVSLAAAATQVGQDENYLMLLMGCPLPEELPMVRRLSQVQTLADLPEGLPSSLLERRPDIKAAEHVLKGANANIGAARANFFPRITLTASLGKMSADYNDLFDAGSRAWSFLPQMTLPIFDMGRNRAALDVAETDRDIAVARYEKAIQTAFREVADTLVQRDNIGNRLEAQEALVSATRRSVEHANTRYGAGVGNFIDLLDAERSLYSAQNGLIAARLLRESNALTLYKALGGGWETL
ncbi:MAG: efflux transporter outer membrane subunit [Deltaproteobacteria bacterium]|nr:efflux transporter outer membrane subunit [Deltaproteobacteria bacterium]